MRPEVQATDIAIIGMAARFPGAATVDQFWDNLSRGVESIRAYSEEELRAAGVSDALLGNPNYVRAGAPLRDIDAFDAGFFGINPKDAAIMDPQHRQFLECSWEALENAGCDPGKFDGLVGVFAGCGPNSYLIHNLLATPDLVEAEGLFALRHTGNDKDLLATRVSYQLNLRGPSVNVQTACSSSLVAVHLACQNLINLECDIALAGAVSIEIPHGLGYLYRDGEVLSRDGKCRSFDARSSGTVFGSGVGIVVLRRLEDALAAGDAVLAVIKGSAVNNDGSRKVGYLAPSVDGQIEVISQALAVAEVAPATVDYLETHGTGTTIGDPIELAALGEIFAGRQRALLVGAVKTNIGHLDTASGIAGLIKTVLALRNRRIPPTLHFESPNPLIDFKKASLEVVTRTMDWAAAEHPRRAGVTSLGIGGTNAHVILEEAPEGVEPIASGRPQLLTISARSAPALDQATKELARYLHQRPDVRLGDVAYTLHRGRREFAHRRAILCRDSRSAVADLESLDPGSAVSGVAVGARRPIAFLFPGQGSQRVGMGRELYEIEPVFRHYIDHCAELAAPHLGLDFRKILYPSDDEASRAAELIGKTWNTQPILFATEYALAQLWMSWGVLPDAMLGHSVGEYVAACLAGVFSLDAAMELVALRGLLMRDVPEGAMLAISCNEDEAKSLLNDGLALAAVNAPDQCVASGPAAAIQELESKLLKSRIPYSRLQTSHAFHSSMMDPILDRFLGRVQRHKLSAPVIDVLSNVTGAWMTTREATDPNYWVTHVRRTVRFHDGLERLLLEKNPWLLEVGPGRVLSSLAARHPAGSRPGRFASMPAQSDSSDDATAVYLTLGRLWTIGAAIDWERFHSGEHPRKVPLPTYPFERSRHWIGPKATPTVSETASDLFFYRSAWRSAAQPTANVENGSWLIFTGAHSLGKEVVRRLEKSGAQVTTVSFGDTFRNEDSHSFSVNPSSGDDMRMLVDQLPQRPRNIVWLWPIEAAEPDVSLDRCFYSPLSFVQRLMERFPGQPTNLGIVSSHLVSVQGEPVACPERATLEGICRVAPQEYPDLRCKHIDVDHPDDVDLVADLIVREVSHDSSGTAVAYRQGERWTENLAPSRFQAGPVGLRTQGVYLIVGGLGGLGLAVSRWLARTYQARLVLVSRNAESRAQMCQTELAEMRREGAEVLVVSADITSAADVRRVVAGARERFGAIHGVVHAAGILDDSIIARKSRAGVERVLSAKIAGTRMLANQLADSPPDFIALFSSISSVAPPAGQVDYCAANAFLNAFAQSRALDTKIVAIGWGPWDNRGMTASPKSGGNDSGRHALLKQLELDTDSHLVFSSSLNVKQDWILSEHRLRSGGSLLPGTVHLELALATARRRINRGAVQLENFVFQEPFYADAPDSQEFQLRLHKSENGFTYSTVRRGKVVAGGQVGAAPCGDERRIDLEAIASRCSQRTVASPRNVRQETHFDFGPHWQSIRRIAFGREECLVELELDSGFQNEVESFTLHPALLDAATGAALFLVPGYDRPGKLYLPFSYRRAVVHHSLTSRILAHIRAHDATVHDVILFDITIANQDGTVLVEIEEFALKGIGDEQAREMRKASLQRVSRQLDGARISERQGVQALQRILESQVTGVIFVSSQDLEARPHPVPATAQKPSKDFDARDSIEGKLTTIWQHVLGVEALDPGADFFDLGGHSLAALRLFAQVRETFGVDFGLAAIFQARTVHDLARLIEGQVRNGTPTQAPNSGSLVAIRAAGSKPPFFCIHGVGGNVLNYQELAKHLGADRPVYGIQSRSLGGLSSASSVEQMAAHYIEDMRSVQPDGPYFVGGQSFGGLVAYEIAQRLQAQGQEVGLVVLIDTFRGEVRPRKGLKYRKKLALYRAHLESHTRRILFGPDRLGYLAAIAQTFRRRARNFVVNRDRRNLERQSRTANWSAARGYNPTPYHGDVVLFRCKVRSPNDKWDYSMGWKPLVQSLRIIEVPGDHNTVMEGPNVNVLAQELSRFLETTAPQARREKPAPVPVLQK